MGFRVVERPVVWHANKNNNKKGFFVGGGEASASLFFSKLRTFDLFDPSFIDLVDTKLIFLLLRIEPG